MSVTLICAWVLAQASGPASQPTREESETLAENTANDIAAGERAAAEGPPTANQADDIFAILEEDRYVTTSIAGAASTTVREAPSSVWIIDREQIETSAATNLADLLRRVPGVLSYDTTAYSSVTSPRGYGHEVLSRVLFMINGRSSTLDLYGTTDLAALGLDLSDIERIEVVVGPSSTTHGTNAFSAAVNIVTRGPSDFALDGKASAGTQWLSRGGNTTSWGQPGFNTRGAVAYGQRFGDWGVRLSAHGEVTTGATVVAPGGGDYAGLVQPSTRYGVNAKITYTLGRWQFGSETQASSILATEWQYSPNRILTRQFVEQLTLSRKGLAGSDDELSITAWGRVLYIASVTDLSALGQDKVSGSLTNAELQIRYLAPSFAHNRLSVGTQLRLGHAAFGGRFGLIAGASTYGLAGLFVEDEFRPVSWFIVTGGVRVETRETGVLKAFSQLGVNPRLSLVLLPNDEHSLRLEFSSAYRNPSVFENVGTYSLASGLQASQANLALRAERHYLGQLGYQGQLGALAPRVEAFYGYRVGEISPTDASATSPLPTTYRNVGDSDYIGFSLHVGYDVMKGLNTFANYTYVYNRVRAVGGRFAASESPRHQAGLGVQGEWGRFSGSTQLYFQDGTYGASPALRTAKRLILNVLVACKIDSAGIFRIFAAATNAIDARFDGAVQRDVADPTAERVGPRVFAGVQLHI